MTSTEQQTDFDHHSAEYAERSHEINAELRSRCPVAHSSAHGGFYVVSRYDDVVAAAKDDETFASGWHINGSSPFGVTIPPSSKPHYPIEMDPPEYGPYRKLLNPMFAPNVSKSWEPRIQRWVDICIDEVIETGRFDIVADLANPVPALFTCEFLGLPIEKWRLYGDLAHEAIYTPPAERADVSRRYRAMLETIREVIIDRRASPRDDAISTLVTAEIQGEPISDDIILNIIDLIMAGGFDTTTAVTSNALIYLAQHPADRTRLIEDPDLIPQASEEFLRHFTPQQALARTVTKPITLGGVDLVPGDRALLSWASANHDEAAFEDPDEVQIDRFPNRHTAFGIGMHRCLGSHIARAELTTMVRRVLDRMPDFEVVVGEAQRYPTIGVVNGWVKVPATFSPAARVGNEHLPASNPRA